MKASLTVSLLVLPLLLQAGRADCSPGPIPFSKTDRSQYQTSLTSLPLAFEKNLGQTAPQVDFLTRAGEYSFLLSPSGLRIVDGGEMSRGLEIVFDKSERAQRAIGVNRLPGVVNYFPGSDPRQWRRQIPTYAEVRYPGVFPKIDLIYHGAREYLEYDFVLAAGADPSQIRMRLAGAEKTGLRGEDLVLQTKIGEFRIHQPKAFQVIRGRRVDVSVRWAVAGNMASFVLGDYDRGRQLVIDPVVSYAHRTSDWTRVLVDSSDNIYISVATEWGGVEVKKTTSNGAMVYDTFLGSANDELKLGAVDSAGNAYVIGATVGSFPVVSQIPGSSSGPTCNAPYYDYGRSCSDGVVVELDATGTVVFSTLLGGSFGELVSAISVDTTGKLYVTGVTASADFPTVNPAQSEASSTVGIAPCGGATATQCQLDGFVAEIDPTAPALIHSTYIGGTDVDFPQGIAVDSAGAVYVTGFTQSPDFPLAQPAHNDGRGFAAKYDATGALKFATYLGGTYEGTAIGIDLSGNILIAGHEYPGWDGFLRKLSPDGSELSTWLVQPTVATNVSGNPISVTGMTIDDQGNAYLTGYTQAYDLPIVNAVQAQNGGQLDGFVTEFSPTGQILFSTYLGGSEGDLGLTIALDSSHAIYVAGVTHSSDFPLLDQSNVTASGSGRGFVVKVEGGSSKPLKVSPNNLVFAPQLKGTTGIGTIAITNVSSTPVTVSSIALDPDLNFFGTRRFAVVSACGSQILPGGNCNVQVSFAPPYPGDYITTLIIHSSVGRLRLGVRGSGLEAGPAAGMSPQTTPGHAIPGQTVHVGLIRIRNFGTDPLMVTNISTTEDFSSKTDCSASLNTSASCTVYLGFSPTTSGERRGSVTISSNDVWGPQTWTLEGFGEDFAIDSPQSTASVTRGSSAEFTINLASNITSPGESVAVALSCSGLPAGTACNFKNSQLIVGSGSTSTTVTITTSAPTVAAIGTINATYASFCMFGLFFCMFTRTRTKGTAYLFLLMFSVALTVSACGSSSQESPTPSTGTPTGTPLGNHTIVVNGTAGSIQHSTNLNLTVN